MAAGAIGRLVAALKAKGGLARIEALYTAIGANSAYQVEAREDRLQADSVVRLSIPVGTLRRKFDQAVKRL
jgi:hypothetical protein